MGDARRKLAEGGQAVGLEELLVGHLQLLGPFLDLAFQGLGETVELLHGALEADPHGFEGRREFLQLLAGIHHHRPVELHRAHGPGPGDQLPDRGVDEAADEKDQEHTDEYGQQDRDDQHPQPDVVPRFVDGVQVVDHLDHTKHLHLFRMRMARRRAAGRLVVHRRHHREVAPARADVDHPGAGIHLHPDEGRPRVVAHGAGRARLSHRPVFPGDAGEHRLPFLVEDPDRADALLVRDHLHDLVGVAAPVGKHGVPGRAGDAFGELVGANHQGVEHLAFLGRGLEVAGHHAVHHEDPRQREDQLQGELVEVEGHGR